MQPLMNRVRVIGSSVYTVSGFFTGQECEAYIRLSEDLGYSAAPLTTPAGPILRPGVRNNSRVLLDDPSRADDLWQRIADLVDPFVDNQDCRWRPIGINERFRFYRYDVGQQFKWHTDGYFERPNGDRSWFTFMVYLNGDFEGGQTAFGKGTVKPESGLALFFDHRLPHTGQPVTRGRKYVFRTDVMYRRDAS